MSLTLLILLTCCVNQLPPCQGSEEQIYRCESLRIQKEQLKRTKAIQIQQSINSFNKAYTKY